MATRPGMVSAVAAWCDCSRPVPVGRVSLADIDAEFHKRQRYRKPWTVDLVEFYLVEIICEEERKKAVGPQIQTDMMLEVWGGDERPRICKKPGGGPDRKKTTDVPERRRRSKQLAMFRKGSKDGFSNKN